MNNIAKKNSQPLKIERKVKKPTWNQITKAANKAARGKSSPNSILSKVESKLSRLYSFYDKNIVWRNRAQTASYVCAVVSITGGGLGLYSFIEPNNPATWFFGLILFGLILLNEVGFRHFADKYADELFLYRKWLNSHLPKFIFFSLVSIIVTSGGFAKWYSENHAPDPTLLAIHAEIASKKETLKLDQVSFNNLVAASTVRNGRDKGRIQYKLEKSVNAARENLEKSKATIAELETRVRGKKVLNPDYQKQVYTTSISGAVILFIFALFYMCCLFYESYFDNRFFAETYPNKYISYLSERNTDDVNFRT